MLLILLGVCTAIGYDSFATKAMTYGSIQPISLSTIHKHGSQVSRLLLFVSNGHRHVASGDYDGNILVTEYAPANPVKTRKFHLTPRRGENSRPVITDIQYINETNVIIASYGGSIVYAIDLNNDSVSEFASLNNDGVTALLYSNIAGTVYAGSSTGSIYRIDVKNKSVTRLHVCEYRVARLMNCGFEHIVAAHRDASTIVPLRAGFAESKSIKGSIIYGHTSSDQIITIDSHENTLYVYNTWKIKMHSSIPKLYGIIVDGCILSGQRIVAITDRNRVVAWDADYSRLFSAPNTLGRSAITCFAPVFDMHPLFVYGNDEGNVVLAYGLVQSRSNQK